MQPKQPKKRGLAQCSKEVRQRVAASGGRASHGGGRPKKIVTK